METINYLSEIARDAIKHPGTIFHAHIPLSKRTLAIQFLVHQKLAFTGTGSDEILRLDIHKKNS
jgi:hypothetical protein